MKIQHIQTYFYRDTLSTALMRRNLSFSQITITDNNFPNSMDLGKYIHI